MSYTSVEKVSAAVGGSGGMSYTSVEKVSAAVWEFGRRERHLSREGECRCMEVREG